VHAEADCERDAELGATMPLGILEGAAGTILILVVLWDAFEVVVLPRRVTRRVRLTRFRRCSLAGRSA